MNDRRPYVSCIKLGGTPLIPPLITPEVKRQCLQYQQKAIQIEMKLERDRLFKQCMEDLETLQPKTRDLAMPQTPCVMTLEMQLTQEDTDLKTKLRNLTTETVDVTEYGREGVKILSRCESLEDSDNSLTTKPKLVRHNSYTLDSPSPILLAHLEREAQRKSEICDRSVEIETPPSIKTNERETPPTIKTNERETPTTIENESPSSYVETDIKIQRVSVTTPFDQFTQLGNGGENQSQIDPQLEQILAKLPPDCVTKILDVLEKQKLEQSAQLVEHQQLKDKVFEDLINQRPPSLSISSSQSLYYSVTSPSEQQRDGDLYTVNLRNVQNCNRKLFGGTENEKEWAASIIGAAAKGFLVRRLIRTEKVQNLIETIKDALLCAIQLHGAETIEAADVELHRRLLQQVSAACYTFHDIFFLLSPKEQMSIISSDRQRKLEKAKRPLSSSSSGRLSESTERSLRAKPSRV